MDRNFYFSFDYPRISRLLHHFQLLEKLESVVYGLADTLSIFKKEFPERKQDGGFSEGKLVKFYLPSEDVTNLHDALHDIRALKKLLTVTKIDDTILKKYSKSLIGLKRAKVLKRKTAAAKNSLEILKKSKISSQIITKLAKEGITQKMLFDKYCKEGVDGIKYLLSISINGKVRITSNKKIITQICDVLEKNK